MKWANEETKQNGIFNDVRKEIEKTIVGSKEDASKLLAGFDKLTDYDETVILSKTFNFFKEKVSNAITMYLFVMQNTSCSAEIPKDVRDAIVYIQDMLEKIQAIRLEKFSKLGFISLGEKWQ